ncbi:MAG TPA: hypothetical protein VEC57_20490 [Candidatus Limnocylindrales bacterium]|nr:hypothetical protein [Candidatus Limnocylindrales bacterium]
MRIFDCFTFFNEFDLLDIRLAELGPVVDRFVLIEADRTHQGQRKPLYFQQRRHEYDSHGDRIAAFVVDDMPPFAGDPWALERHQRARTGSFLEALGARPDDLVLISDVDEIPRAASIPAAVDMVRRRKFAVFVQRLYRFYLNNVTRDDEHLCGWCGTVACLYSQLSMYNAERVRGRWCNGGQFHRFAGWSRRRRCIADAGWHFTSMGGPTLLRYKLQSFAHPELDDPQGERIHAAWSHAGQFSVPDDAPRCQVYDGNCVCGCTWKSRPQRYALPGTEEFEEALASLPAYVRDHAGELAALFRTRAPGTGGG